MRDLSQTLPLIAVLLFTLPLPSCGDASSEPPAEPAPQTPASQQNAAEEYRSLYEAMSPALLSNLEDAGDDLTPAVVASLPAADPIVARLVWATSLERCDWGIDYSLGYDIELPHLTKLRNLVRLLRAHARQSLAQGDPDAAAADVAAITRLSRHVGGKSYIEALVAIAVLNTAFDLTADNAGGWNEAQRAEILTELRAIDAQDPFNATAALAWDKQAAARAFMPPSDEQRFFEAKTKTITRLTETINTLE